MFFLQRGGDYKKNEFDLCQHCKETTIKTCCYCELKLFRGLYEECNECLGFFPNSFKFLPIL